VLKFGIRRLADFSSASSSPLHFRSLNRISYQLLHTAQPPSPLEVRLFDHVMRLMQLSSGVFRTTVRQRFADLDPQIENLLASHFPAASPLVVHDWAASSCLTSAEWAASLFACFPAASLHASDLTLFLLEATLPDQSVLIYEPGGAPLQYITGPFVVRLVPRESRALPINAYLAARGQAKYDARPQLQHLPAEWLALDPFATPEINRDGLRLRKIPVVHPEAGALARQDSRFRILRHSAFDALPAPVDVIRTMNIFNQVYFPPERLIEGARAVWHSLRPSGIWIVGRTVQADPHIHEVSVFTRTHSGFALLWRSGPGSEIESLVLEAAFPG